jgi:hypothetical protein
LHGLIPVGDFVKAILREDGLIPVGDFVEAIFREGFDGLDLAVPPPPLDCMVVTETGAQAVLFAC